MKVAQLLIGLASLAAFGASGHADSQTVEKDFLWYCESDEATAAQKNTVKAIYLAKEIEEDYFTCKEMNNFLVGEQSISLDFEDQPITDLSPLNGLDNLTNLYCNKCNKDAVESIPALPILQTLETPNSGITSLDHLSRFPKLQHVDIRGFDIDKTTDLSALKKIDSLVIGNAAITNLHGFEQIDKLSSLIILEIDSFPAHTLPNLNSLDTFKGESIKIQDLSFLDKMPNLRHLDISGENLSGTRNYHLPSSLEMLHLRDNHIDYIPADQIPTDVYNLVLTDNPLSELGFLANLPKLRDLELERTQLKSWAQLDPVMPTIKELWLTKSPLQAKAIPTGKQETWQNLERLYIGNTNVTSLEFFKRVKAPKLDDFEPPHIENKTEANCPVTDVPPIVADYCRQL